MGTEPIKTRLISLMHLTLTQCFKINTKVTSKIMKNHETFQNGFRTLWLISSSSKNRFHMKIPSDHGHVIRKPEKNAMPHLSILKDIETFSKSFSIVQTDMKSFLSS